MRGRVAPDNFFLFGVIRIITCAGMKPVRVAQTFSFFFSLKNNCQGRLAPASAPRSADFFYALLLAFLEEELQGYFALEG